MFCTKCGNALPEGTKFCTACGAKIEIPEGYEPLPTAEIQPVEVTAEIPQAAEAPKEVLLSEEPIQDAQPVNETVEEPQPAEEPVQDVQPVNETVEEPQPAPVQPTPVVPTGPAGLGMGQRPMGGDPMMAGQPPVPPVRPEGMPKPQPQQKAPGKGFKVATIILSIVLGLSIVGSGIMMFLFASQITADEEAIRTLDNQLDMAQAEADDYAQQLDASRSEYNALSNQMDDLRAENIELSTALAQYENQTDLFALTMDYLRGAKTTNGIISVENRIYCVKQGSTSVMKVTWPSYVATQYMGTDDRDVAEGNWLSNNNVEIVGVGRGVTTMHFGSDSDCAVDRFEVVIICY